jgi:DNA-binding MarR family transcriptional regulator
MASIEEEIKQKAFVSEQAKATINLLFTANWVQSQISAVLRPYGLSPEQFNVLRILNGSHPNAMSQKDILSRMIAPKSNLTLIVGRLKEKKFVNVNRALHDKREYSISITNSAQSMLQDLNQGMNQLLRATLPLNEIEAQTLNALLDKIRTPNL